MLKTIFFTDRKRWAIENCKDMQEVWDKVEPSMLIAIATVRGVLSNSDLLQFTLMCLDHVKHKMTESETTVVVKIYDCLACKISNGHMEIIANTELTKAKNSWLEINCTVAHAAAAVAAIVNSKDDIIGHHVWCIARSIDNQQPLADWLRANTKPNFEDQPTNINTQTVSDLITALDCFVKAKPKVLTYIQLKAVNALIEMQTAVIATKSSQLEQTYRNTLKDYYDFLMTEFDLLEETVTSKKFTVKRKDKIIKDK